MEKKIIKVEASVLNSAIATASIGGGTGYVMLISPKTVLNKEGKKVQSVLIASSDGEKMGRRQISVYTEGIEEKTTIYPAKSFQKVAATLAKVTDIIVIELKGSYIELSGEKGNNRVRVPLNESGQIFDIPKEEMVDEEGKPKSIFALFKTENLINAFRCGSIAAQQSKHGIVYFGISGGEFTVTSYSTAFASRSTVKMEQSQNVPKTHSYHLADCDFINAVCSNLAGEEVQISFTNTFLVISDSSGNFYTGRKVAGSMAESIERLLEEEEKEYSATCKTKDFQIALQIATVGITDSEVFSMATQQDGTLLLQPEHDENMASMVQSAHEGYMKKSYIRVELFQKFINSIGEEFTYYGMNEGNKSKDQIHFTGKFGTVNYRAILCKVNRETRQNSEKKEEKGKEEE